MVPQDAIVDDVAQPDKQFGANGEPPEMDKETEETISDAAKAAEQCWQGSF